MIFGWTVIYSSSYNFQFKTFYDRWCDRRKRKATPLSGEFVYWLRHNPEELRKRL